MTASREQSAIGWEKAIWGASLLGAFLAAGADGLMAATWFYLGHTVIGPSWIADLTTIGAVAGAALLGTVLAVRKMVAGDLKRTGRASVYSRLVLAVLAVVVPIALGPLEHLALGFARDWFTLVALLLVAVVPAGILGIFYAQLLRMGPGRWLSALCGLGVGFALAYAVLWPLYGVGFVWIFAGGISLMAVLSLLPMAMGTSLPHTPAPTSRLGRMGSSVAIIILAIAALVIAWSSWRVTEIEDPLSGYRAREVGGALAFSGSEVAADSDTILGHLGPLLHSRPRAGLLVGPRSAQLLQAAAAHPYVSLDVSVESQTIWRGLAGSTGAAWEEDERLAVFSGGVRYLLRRRLASYDVITLGGSDAKARGGMPYHTVEFYRQVGRALKTGGIVVQLLGARDVTEPQMRRIVGTFAASFNDVHLFAVPGRDLFGDDIGLMLVGSDAQVPFDFAELGLRLAEPRIAAAADPARLKNTDDLLDLYIADDVAIRRWTAGLERLSDRFTRLWHGTSNVGKRPFEPVSLLGVRTTVMHRVEGLPDDPSKNIERRHLGFEAFGLALAGRFQRAAEILPGSERLQRAVEQRELSRDYYAARAEKNRDDAEVLFECGSALCNMGYLTEGIELFQKALSLEPNDLSLVVNTALARADAGDLTGALELLERAAGENQNDWLLQYNLGSLKIRAGDPGGALVNVQAAMTLSPRHEGLLLAFADANLQLGRGDVAERAAQQIIALNPYHPEAWDLLGLVSQSREEYPKARRRHRRALMLHPYRPSTHYNMGVVLQNEGRILEAASAYRAALYIEPRDAEAQNNLGLLYASAGLFERAVAAYQQALDLVPHYPEAAYNLGLSYLGMGQSMAAAEAFGLALKMAPDLEAARERLKEMGLESVEIQVEDLAP